MCPLHRFTPNSFIQLSQLSRRTITKSITAFSSYENNTSTNSRHFHLYFKDFKPVSCQSNSINHLIRYASSSTKPVSQVDLRRKDKPVVNLDMDLINHLERTSLVDFDNEEALTRLQEAIRFADTLLEVDTEGVTPMISVLEDETLYLREDKAQPTSRDDILLNASVTEEDYFVAPPGNIPLESQSSKAFKNKQ